MDDTGPMPARENFSILLLYAARAARGFGDGFAVILLPAYLAAIDFTPVEIGFIVVEEPPKDAPPMPNTPAPVTIPGI